MNNITAIAKAIHQLKSDKEVRQLLNELFTQSELDTLSKRWCILNMLNQGITQRDIAQKLNVSLCKITRGAKILKNKKNIIQRFLKGNKENE